MIAVSVVRLSQRLTRVSEEMQLWLVQVRQVTGEAREVVSSLRGVAQPVQRAVDRFGKVGERFAQLGERTVRMSALLLEEVEAPVRNVVAITRGVRTGTAQFLERLTSRFRHGRPATDGGIRYE
ncbi:MAG TPA: hypothetical protein VFP58_06240 [Candidatus Eisenbacteria bacterium]|nr:hypothetical protein [Candidatus Eisenbacteria bacterium]